jgi:hypothetical protein
MGKPEGDVNTCDFCGEGLKAQREGRRLCDRGFLVKGVTEPIVCMRAEGPHVKHVACGFLTGHSACTWEEGQPVADVREPGGAIAERIGTPVRVKFTERLN